MNKNLTSGHHILQTALRYDYLFEGDWVIDSVLDHDHPVLYLDSFLPKNDPRYPDKYKVGNRVRYHGSYGTVVGVDTSGAYGLTVQVKLDNEPSIMVLSPGLDPFWGQPKRR